MNCFHPEIKSNFFTHIDSKEKAYWLGFLFADGGISNNRINLCSSLKDEHWIDKYCLTLGIYLEEKRYYTQKNGRTYVSIGFSDKEIADSLKSYGCVPKKSRIIRYPTLATRELDLAFVMGYFDGDGHQDGTEIYSGSSDFLKDIQVKFNLTSEPFLRNPASPYPCFELYLGAAFFKELCNNYPNSLPRKRKTYAEQKELFGAKVSITQEPWNKGISRPETHKVLHPTKEELEKLVWEKPCAQLSKELGVSDKAIEKWCTKLGVSKPPRGYWAKKYAKTTIEEHEKLKELDSPVIVTP